MNDKAWIDDKIPRFCYLNSYKIYWGVEGWCETFDISKPVTKTDCMFLLLKRTYHVQKFRVISFLNRGKSI